MLTPETLLHERYRIVQLVGQGGMGAVYEAVDERLRSPVALKQTLVSGDSMARAFEREAQLLAGLRHQALPRVIDHFVAPEGQFLVMEFIPGQDLAAALGERGAPFPLAQVLAWGDVLLDALDYLHGQNPPVIHRDIKPQNLKLTPRGEIVLLDFGLAKGSAALPTRAPTEAASLFGYTPQYAPLEQVQGAGTDPRADLYSLAATLYHLATGQPPADALTRATAVLNGKPDPLRPADAFGLPTPVAGALAMAMALRADERFGSARAMRNALRQSAESGPPAALGATLVTRQEPAATRPHPAHQPIPAPVAPVETQAAATRPAAPAPQPAPPAAPARRASPPPERRGSPLPLLLGAILVLTVLGGGLWFLFGRGGDEAAQVVPSAPTADPREAAPTAAPPAGDQAASSGQPSSGQSTAPGQGAAPAGDATPITLTEDFIRLEGEITSPGAKNRYTFTAEAGQGIFIWHADADGTGDLDVALFDVNDDLVTSRCLACGNTGAVTLDAGGAYTLVVGSDRAPSTGSYEVRVNLLPPPLTFDVGLDVRIAGDQPGAGAGVIRVPGARNAFRFTAEPGQAIFIWHAGADGTGDLDVTLLDANDDVVSSRCLACGNTGAVTLDAGGAYTLIVGSGRSPGTGRFDLRVNAIPPAEQFAVTLPFRVGDGRPAAGAGQITKPGAAQVYSFEAQAGQRIFIDTLAADGTGDVNVALLDANGDEVTSRCLACGDIGAVTLNAGGAYTLVVGSNRSPGTGRYELEVTPVP